MAKLKKRPDGRYQGKLRIATVDGAPKYKYVFGKSPAKKSRPKAAPMVGDITYRLNVNSIPQVYSAFLPALLLYANLQL